MTACSCVEDVVCGACMTGAVDPVTGAPTPPADDDLTDDEYDAKYGLRGPLDEHTSPADDVREALYAQIAADLIDIIGWQRISADLVRGIVREWERHTAAEVRPRGTVTDAEVDAVWNALELDNVGHYSRRNVRAALEAARLS